MGPMHGDATHPGDDRRRDDSAFKTAIGIAVENAFMNAVEFDEMIGLTVKSWQICREFARGARHVGATIGMPGRGGSIGR